jgi:hypothetical protein
LHFSSGARQIRRSERFGAEPLQPKATPPGGRTMDGQNDLPVTEFERALQGLAGLTRNEIVALVIARVDRDDDLAFAALTESLSLETLRLLSARALLAA